MDTAISVLRWIAVLPGALLAATLARFIVYLGTMLGIVFAPEFPSDAFDALDRFVQGALMGAMFAFALIFSGVGIAPSKKTATGLVLTVLLALISSFWAIDALPTTEDPMILGEIIGQLAWSILILVAVWRGTFPGTAGRWLP